MKKDSMHNLLKQCEIELAVLKKRTEEWQRKKYQMRTIQGKRFIFSLIQKNALHCHCYMYSNLLF